jgi:hypothetical protein
MTTSDEALHFWAGRGRSDHIFINDENNEKVTFSFTGSCRLSSSSNHGHTHTHTHTHTTKSPKSSSCEMNPTKFLHLGNALS